MPLDRISSATAYAALALVQAATANPPRLATPAAGPGPMASRDATKVVTPGASMSVFPRATPVGEGRVGTRLDVVA